MRVGLFLVHSFCFGIVLQDANIKHRILGTSKITVQPSLKSKFCLLSLIRQMKILNQFHNFPSFSLRKELVFCLLFEAGSYYVDKAALTLSMLPTPQSWC